MLASEILYRDDFEPAALLPCFIASAVGYAVFGAVEGFTPLFGDGDHYHFSDPSQLGWFAVIGVLGGLVGLLYARGFYGIAGLFDRSPLPRWTSPAIGGLLVGAAGIAIPEVLGTGYGWIQQSLDDRLTSLPLWIVLVLPLARIVATGLTVGSGGSGGIFGPGMVIGAFVGAAVWRLFDPLVPSMGHDPAPYVIAGMMCCFGGISRAPLAVTIMVVEMTGTVSALEPAMVAVGLSWIIVRHVDDTMYRSQLHNRPSQSAGVELTGLPLLAGVPVTRAMSPPRLILDGGMDPARARRSLTDAGVSVAPVVDEDGRYEGTVTLEAIDGAGPTLRSAVDAGAAVVRTDAHLDVALDALASSNSPLLTVVSEDGYPQGTLTVAGLVRSYRAEMRASLSRDPIAGQPDLEE